MANTYTQIYMHIVFAVAHREAMISESWAENLYAYLAGICNNRKDKALAIGGIADHVHMLVGMHPSDSVAALVKELKGASSHWINQNHCHGTFAWQSGYGAFSYNGSLLPVVKQYIANQREHHRHIPFAEEVERMFRKAGIEYDPQYMMYGLVSPTEGVS
jgi:REP element-mobilizing transposase RayT